MADGDTLAEGRGGAPTLADEDNDDDAIGTVGATPEDEAGNTAAWRGTTTTTTTTTTPPPSPPAPPPAAVSHQTTTTTTTGAAADHNADTTTTPAGDGDQYTTTSPTTTTSSITPAGGGDQYTTTAPTPGATLGAQDTTSATLGLPAGRGGLGTSTTTPSDDRTRDTDPGHRRGRESGGGGEGEGRGEGGAGGDSNHRASQHPRRGAEPLTLHHAGTQTPPVTRTTKGTSTTTTTREAATTPSPTPSPPRTPTRHYPRQHRAAYTPLPDRLSGPWSQRAHATTTAPPHPPLPPHAPSPARSVLATLQQSLYTKILQRASTQDTTQILHNSLRLKDLQAGVGLAASYTTTNPHVPHLHNTHPLPHHHFRRPLLPSPPASPPPRAYRYPVVRPESVLSSSTLAAVTQLHLRGSTGDLLSRQHPAAHTYTYGGIRVRGSASLPDLYDPSPTPLTHALPPPRPPRHAHSARDVMYSSGLRERRWASYWRGGEESDSGGSTDSLIDEAEFIASSASAPLDYFPGPRVYEFGDERQQRRRQARRRTRSHQGAFPSWRGDSTSTTGTPAAPVGGGSGRPYLPYRGDQLTPGQQVKVLAPGGGVAVARVLANQQGPRGMKGRHHEYEDAVTVVLLCEPNRLQGSVVTVPLEKVLLAWPRA